MPIFLAAVPEPTTSGACLGADPAVTNLTSQLLRKRDGTDHYVITATVTNIGSQNQTTDITQRVELLRDGNVFAPQNLPALGTGVEYKVAFAIDRPAADRSHPLKVTVRYRLLTGDATVNECNRDNDALTKTF